MSALKLDRKVVGRRTWHGECFGAGDELGSCSAWCAEMDFGGCLYIETSRGDECSSRGDGDQWAGWCSRDPFAAWPEPENLWVRCICAGGGR